jgi:SAM-dependent methyltransferase
MTQTHAHHDHGHHQQHRADSEQAEILDLDAEVLAEHIAAITEWLPLKSGPRQIVDLASGTGAGTFALLERFPEAHVTAVDASPGHLERLRTVLADLDDAIWPDLGTPDLVWASASMHHMADPGHALRAVRDLLAPDGLFAVVELAGLPRFLPENAPANRPGLEDRVHAVTDRLHAEHLPHRGADWGQMLNAAGFAVAGELTVAVDIDGSRNAAIGRYALGVLQRIRGAAAAELAAEDLTALDRLLDTSSPHSVLRRDDLAVRTERTVWAARRN